MSRASKAFTLIELLVVVAIIALLIAILLPSLARARELSKTSVCLANLHGLAVGTSTYVADNDGLLFPCEINKNAIDGSGAVQLHQILIDYVKRGAINSVNNDTGTTGSGNERTGDKVYFCPSALAPKKLGVNTQYPLTYGANMGVHVRQTPDKNLVLAPLKKITEIPRPNEAVTLADGSQNTAIMNTGDGHLDGTGTTWGATPAPMAPPGGDGAFDNMANAAMVVHLSNGWDMLTDNGNYHIRARHNYNKAENVLLLDGHAETMALKQLLWRNLSTTY